MASLRFEHVSIEKLATVYYEGRSFSRSVFFANGQLKILGILLPCDEKVPEYVFATEASERIEILSGECEVKVAGSENFTYYVAGQSFVVAGHSNYIIRNSKLLQYICHSDG